MSPTTHNERRKTLALLKDILDIIFCFFYIFYYLILNTKIFTGIEGSFTFSHIFSRFLSCVYQKVHWFLLCYFSATFIYFKAEFTLGGMCAYSGYCMKRNSLKAIIFSLAEKPFQLFSFYIFVNFIFQFYPNSSLGMLHRLHLCKVYVTFFDEEIKKNEQISAVS